MTTPAGWYPDPSGSGQQRYIDGNEWGPFAPMAPPPVAEKVREPNPLFTVLAVLSAIPTAFFGLVYITRSQSNIAGLLLIWFFMWTWVWWKLRVPLTALAAAVQEAAPDGETLQEGCRHPPLMSPRMSNAAQWAISASVKFREVARTTENPTTKLLAEGLTHLAEAVRELDQQVGHVEDTIKSLRDK